MEIKKIVLDLKGKELSLSVEEARELKRILGELFGENVNRYIYSTPYYAHPWTVYTSGSTGTLTVSNAKNTAITSHLLNG